MSGPRGSLYRDNGVVLRTYKLGEADRIVVFATQHHGKVRAVAKGVRKTRSKFGSRLEPMSHVALQLYQGRELDIVTQAESIDHFRAIREDLDRFGHASSMLEAVDQMSLEREENVALYTMLVGALRTLADHDSPLVVAAFYWKLLAQEGFRPELDVCVGCGEDADLVAFDLEEGGTLCRVCRSGVPISADALDLMRAILGGQLVAALSLPASPATREVDQLATRAMEHHLERRLRSVGMLDRG
jgi:DNA repair protein RecO (recombination protein O)